MTNTNPSNRKQSTMAKGVGMLLVVALLFSSQAPSVEAAGNIKRDWSRVQTVAPGTRTTVLLYRDLAAPGKRKIKGRFHSATTESVTLMLPSGQRSTLEKRDVRRVLVYRPLGKRYQVPIVAAIGGGIGIPFSILAAADTVAPAAVFSIGIGIFVGIPVAIALLVAPRMGGIYNVPRHYKSPPDDRKRQGSAPNRRD